MKLLIKPANRPEILATYTSENLLCFVKKFLHVTQELKIMALTKGTVTSGPVIPLQNPLNPSILKVSFVKTKPLQPNTYYLVLIVSKGCPRRQKTTPATDPWNISRNKS